MTDSTPPRSWLGWLGLIGLWLVTVVLAFLFVSIGMTKLSAAEPWTSTFAGFGFPVWFRLVIGALEVGGALLLLVPRAAPIGALVLAVVMIGAAGTHLVHDEPGRIVVNLVYLALLGLVAWARWGGVRRAPSMPDRAEAS